MRAIRHPRDDISVYDLSGHLDSFSWSALEDLLVQEQARGAAHIVLGLAGVRFASMRVVMRLHDVRVRLAAAGRLLELVAPSAAVQEVIDLLGLRRQLPCRASAPPRPPGHAA